MEGVVEGTPEGNPEAPKDHTLTPTKPPGSKGWAQLERARPEKKVGTPWDADLRYVPEGGY